ncbi:head maturation protease, ClpP-related [Nonomuraea rhodomycinica]|uniref:ATP-dependent Clp protease proteolytic subunit n=1 Tax=Nonomuraea rhodomycinica TaxID=1712872 RepID=A0A7Y6IW86_9ACTN|nr:head maturation protease, ClpP-related [Nonomuraea rhodomycinica]NUW45551.1 Clp protease ClpP [Nonomuraea rhodomycinica]
MRQKTARPQARTGTDRWYQIRNLADGAAEVVIFDEIGWWGTSAADFIQELKQVTASEITLRLNSPGGDVFDGVAIMNTLRAHPAKVTAHVVSLAASIASVIAMGADRVVMQPHSQMMIHDASGLCVGDASDMRSMADMLDRQSDNIAAVYAARAGGTVAEWRERMAAETWFTAEEAVAAGLADEVAARREDEPSATNSWDLSVFRYAGRESAPAPVVATATAQTPPAEPAAGPAITDQEEDSMSTLSEGLRERLGIGADAELDDDALLAALDEALTERADPDTPEPAPAPEPVAARLPEGTVLVDKATLDQLREDAAQGVAARAQQRTEARDRVLDDAIASGKFPPARREHWARLWDADPDGTRDTLANLAEGTVPLADLGEPGGDDLTADTEFDHLFSRKAG